MEKEDLFCSSCGSVISNEQESFQCWNCDYIECYNCGVSRLYENEDEAASRKLLPDDVGYCNNCGMTWGMTILPFSLKEIQSKRAGVDILGVMEGEDLVPKQWASQAESNALFESNKSLVEDMKKAARSENFDVFLDDFEIISNNFQQIEHAGKVGMTLAEQAKKIIGVNRATGTQMNIARTSRNLGNYYHQLMDNIQDLIYEDISIDEYLENMEKMFPHFLVELPEKSIQAFYDLKNIRETPGKGFDATWISKKLSELFVIPQKELEEKLEKRGKTAEATIKMSDGSVKKFSTEGEEGPVKEEIIKEPEPKKYPKMFREDRGSQNKD